MRSPTLLIAAALAGLVATLPLLGTASAQRRAARSDIIAVDDIKPGMKGYGLTVFQGYEPEKFDVEVIDVLKNFRPRQDLILIKTPHPRLDVAKIVAGMSGSPIFLNGKMAGAYAYGWTFAQEPIAGVTPIENMIEDLDQPLPKQINGWPLGVLPRARRTARVDPRSLNPRHRFAGTLAEYDVQEHANQIARENAALGPGKLSPVEPVSTPLLMGGMTPGAVQAAKALFEPMGLTPLQAGGGGGVDPQAPTRFVNGGAIGVQMISGDMSVMGLGTVTRVEGDRVSAFGHPMMQSGVTAMPTAVGKVIWFMASQMRSFKIGMPGRTVGALVNDRQASIVASHSTTAPTVPVTLKIKGATGAPTPDWQFEVAHEKFMTTAFMAIALGSALQAVAPERRDVSWNATSELQVQGLGTITFEDFGVAIGGTPQPGDFVRSNVVRAVGMLLNNPWEPVIIERLSMEIELRYGREILRLRGAEVLDPELEPGEPARIRLALVPWAGPEITKVITVPVPEHLAGKEIKMSIGPGYTVYKEKPDPENLRQLFANLRDPVYPPKSIVVSFSAQSGGIAFQGKVARNLPPGALDALRPTSTSIGPDAFGTEVRHVVALDDFMLGRDTVSVQTKKVLR